MFPEPPTPASTTGVWVSNCLPLTTRMCGRWEGVMSL